ncbi:hypothetical protein CAEBREN_24262 [Caenorhabditis brenneri]|uniref:6-phosphogluconolactonase n=1 Tax=Caenorhabditis brenneri TaxID=135651 RepID=G0P4V5_CAEBE|nr:hypothetical protein CAEBREN_24262 [Caenorhabditis brenneri]
MKPQLNVSADDRELNKQLCTYIHEKLTYLLEQSGIISIGVSGGSMPKVFSKAFLHVTSEIRNLNWKRIRIFMVDERNVEIEDEDSNLGAYLKLFPEELHEIFVPFPYHKDVRHSAREYELNLRKYLLPEQLNNIARFDMLFLGVGPDGHTASIFPGRERLEKVNELNWVGAVSESPKPPPSRVTLTLQCIQHAKNTAFIISGRQKAEIVRGIWHRDFKYPAAQARPYNGKLTLFVDEDAAVGIPNPESGSESDSTPPPLG